jgi:hypothetical protein
MAEPSNIIDLSKNEYSITQSPFGDITGGGLSLGNSDQPLSQSSPFNFMGPGIDNPKYNPQAQLAIARKDIEALEAKQSSFMPTFIATAAALTGNFGPAMMLQEQKRKTNLGKQLLPVMANINTLKNQGNWDAAMQVAQEAGAKVGERSPELLQFFTRITDDISKRQRDWRNVETWYNMEGKFIKEGHPRYQMAETVKAALKNQTPFTWDAMNAVLQDRQHVQNINDQTIITSPGTGQSMYQAIPQVVQGDELKTFGGMQIQAAHGITQAELQNTLNKTTQLTEKEQQIKQDFVNTKGMDAVLKYISPLVPLEPIIATQMLDKTSPVRVALRDVIDRMSPLMKEHYNRITEQKIAEIEGGLRADPFKAAQSGMTFIDFRSPGVDFGREMPLMTAREAAASGGGIVPVRQQVADTIVKPALNAKQGLLKITDLLVALSNPEGLLEALPAELNLRASRLLGRGVAPGMKQATAASVILKRAIEEAGQTMKVPEADVGALKSQIASEFINPQDSIDAVNMLIDWVNERMKREVGSSNVQEGFVPPYNPNPTRQQQEDIKKFGLGKAQKGYQEHLKQQRQQKYQGVR